MISNFYTIFETKYTFSNILYSNIFDLIGNSRWPPWAFFINKIFVFKIYFRPFWTDFFKKIDLKIFKSIFKEMM